MALTKSEARTTTRRRIRDTVATYEYSDALLDSYLAPALREIAIHVCEVDPDFYLRSFVIAGYDDAVDAVSLTAGEQGYEFYALPTNVKSVRWLERYDSGYHYRIPVVSARDQEEFRYGRVNLGFTQISVRNGSTTSISPGVGLETASIHGNRIRVVPPPAATGPQWRVFHDAYPDFPEGENEPVDVPLVFEESLILAWGRQTIQDDGDPLYQQLTQRQQEQLSLAKTGSRARSNRSVQVGRVW